MTNVFEYRFHGDDIAIRLQALFLCAQRVIVYWPFESLEGIHSLLAGQNDFYVMNRGQVFTLMDDENGREGMALLATLNDEWWARLGRHVMGAAQIPIPDKTEAHIIFTIGWRRRLVTLPCDLTLGMIAKDQDAIMTESEYWPNVGLFSVVHQKLVRGAAIMTERLNRKV